ncbi:hypothetical protein H4R19_005257 [Coemansia spiralis]|nr:hypothetical protein H4R19_005257 [Coemansia spiralis]
MSGVQKSRWDDEDGDQRQRTGHTRRPRPKKEPAPVVDQPAPPTSEPAPAVAAKLSPVLPTHRVQDFGHLSGCRQVDECYKRLNKIEEGTYGIVYRAQELATGDIVALKQLKLDQERNGFPITSLREIHTLLLAKHPNIVNVREIAAGKSLSSIYIVMDFMDHDLRTLMEGMPGPFQPSETKSLLQQLCSAVEHLHNNWIVHRDLKTSNLLMQCGNLRVADFGLARKYSSPLGKMTGLVVTLWYRAPELLMGETHYSAAVDMWSVGCIFAELLLHRPLFAGTSEIAQITSIFAACGVPTRDTWPGFADLPNARMFKFAANTDRSKRLRARVAGCAGLTDNAYDLLERLLTLDPARRITASEALDHPYFAESPPPKHPSMFPTWPSRTA